MYLVNLKGTQNTVLLYIMKLNHTIPITSRYVWILYEHRNINLTDGNIPQENSWVIFMRVKTMRIN